MNNLEYEALKLAKALAALLPHEGEAEVSVLTGPESVKRRLTLHLGPVELTEEEDE